MPTLKLRYLSFLLGLFCSFDLFCQNLLQNPSFEIDSLSSGIDFNPDNNFTPSNWNTLPKTGGADYFSINRKNNYGVPNNVFGWQNAFDGHSYVGISIAKGGIDRAEFIQTKLIKPLEPNKYYCFSMYVSLSENGNGSFNELDYLLSKNTNLENLKHKLIISSKLAKSKENWVELTSVYKAKGGEQYLTIGLFAKNPKFFYSDHKNDMFQNTYYYLDNISLTEVVDTTGCIPHTMSASRSSFDLAIGKPLTLKNINFETNSSQISESSYPELNNLVDYLKKNPIYKIEISGHTDNSGGESSNITLSGNRAKSLAQFLIQKGISGKRITYKGYGSSKPLKPNTTEENKLINRRVEIILNK